MRTIYIVCVIALIGAMMVTPAAASDWSAFQKDSHNTGLTSDKAPITNPYGNGISWEQSFAANFDEAPVVVGDTVYVVGADNKVRAMNKTTGALKWETSTSGGGWLLGNMGAGNGTIFVPTSDGKIFGINDTNGTVDWSATESGQMNTPVVYDDHKIYFGDWGGNNAYYCYSDNGTKIWQRDSNGAGYYWAGAATIGDYLVYGDDASHLTSVYKANGTTVHEMDVSTVFSVTANEIRSSICYVEDMDRIYFTSKGHYIYALGMNDNGTFDTTDKHHANIGYSTSTPAVYNGKVYVGAGGMSGGGNGVSCLDTELTAEYWHFAADAGSVQSSPAISTAYDDGDGEVYIYFTTNTNVGKVYCVNESGDLQWSWGASGKTSWTLCGVAISDGWIFYGTDSKYVFGFATNESLWPCLGTCYDGDVCGGTPIMEDVPCWGCLTEPDRSWEPTTNCLDRDLHCPPMCIVDECPACANGVDDDGDGLVDCDDPGCACCCDFTELDGSTPTPCVPELATATLLGLGLVMLVGIVRFKRRD